VSADARAAYALAIAAPIALDAYRTTRSMHGLDAKRAAAAYANAYDAALAAFDDAANAARSAAASAAYERAVAAKSAP